MSKVLFSGSAPSGMLTIGNYLGAIRHWQRMQEDYDCVFCVVDLHAISVPREPIQLQERTLDFFALYLACGIDPQKAIVFVQSHNHMHAELAWMLNCVTQYGELGRMTQFKEKSRAVKTVTAGLFNYPVLMAADILLYDTSLVPVGEDQKQHLELTRNIAQRFNDMFGQTFTAPEVFIAPTAARVKSLVDPEHKMDKSDPNPKSYISLLDTAEVVREKLSKAKTDSVGNFPIDDPSEGIANLVMIFSELSGESKSLIVDRYGPKGYGALKRDLAEVVLQKIGPVQERYNLIRNDRKGLENLLELGSTRAVAKGQPIINKVRDALGLVRIAGTT
jgi:tryptophanyl-tRNA synthetase